MTFYSLMRFYVVRVDRQRKPPCRKHWPLMQQSNDKEALLFHTACFFESAEITTQASNESLSQTKKNNQNHAKTDLTSTPFKGLSI